MKGEGRAATVLQITIIPEAVIKPHWSVDPGDWLESLQTSRQEQDNYQPRTNSCGFGTAWLSRCSSGKGVGGNVKDREDAAYTMCARLRGFSGISGNMGWRGSLLDAQLSDLLRAWDNFFAGDFCRETQCCANCNEYKSFFFFFKKPTTKTHNSKQIIAQFTKMHCSAS